jgi:hypothetical protein
MNAHSGHIDRSDDFHASDDVEAIHQVRGRPCTSNMELWSEGRKISRFEAGPDVFELYQLEARQA